MSEFKFKISQRVTLPVQSAGEEGVQGVVSGIFDRLGFEPLYAVQWMQSSGASAEKGILPRSTGNFEESELLSAQPPKMIPEDEAAHLVRSARADAVYALRCKFDPEMDRLRETIARLELRAQVRAAKAKRNRKCR